MTAPTRVTGRAVHRQRRVRPRRADYFAASSQLVCVSTTGTWRAQLCLNGRESVMIGRSSLWLMAQERAFVDRVGAARTEREMDPLDLTQSFVERCERSAPISALTAAFQGALEQMGFRYFACCSHVNPLNPPLNAVVLYNVPSVWAHRYADRDLHKDDPVFRRAERDLLPFHWNRPDFRAGLALVQQRILAEAASVGIANGYTVPIHVPWAAAGPLPASCSVIPDSNSIDDRAHRAVQVMAVYLYASASHRPKVKATRANMAPTGAVLSPRERECLERAAEGKSDWEISQLLGISEHTVHKHVEAAKRRLGVSTRIQAIVWAVQHREICFGDVVRPIVPGRRTAPVRLPVGMSIGLNR